MTRKELRDLVILALLLCAVAVALVGWSMVPEPIVLTEVQP